MSQPPLVAVSNDRFRRNGIHSGASPGQHQARRAGLILAHQPAVTHHVCDENGGKPALYPIRRSTLHGAPPRRGILYPQVLPSTTVEGPNFSLLGTLLIAYRSSHKGQQHAPSRP